MQYGWEHFEEYLATNPDRETAVFRCTMETAAAFLKSYSLSTKFQDSDIQLQHDEILRFVNELPREKRDKYGHFNLVYRTINIRKQIEAMRCEPMTTAEHEVVNNLHGGHVVYKCPKPWCDLFATGFGLEKDRTQHEDRHDKPFQCPEEGCFRSQLGFDDESKLDRHRKDHHADIMIMFPEATSKTSTDKIYNIGDAAAKGELFKVAESLDAGVDSGQMQLEQLQQQMLANIPYSQDQSQQMAIQAQQQIQMLSSKFYNENLPQMLRQHDTTLETCPPERLHRFKMQCLSMAGTRVAQMRQQQQAMLQGTIPN